MHNNFIMNQPFMNETLFDYMSDDFNVPTTELIKEFRTSSYPMFLKKNGETIGILIMDDRYSPDTQSYYHFIKYLWIEKEFRRQRIGSQVLTNIKNLPHKLTNAPCDIILGVQTNMSHVIPFYLQNGFIMTSCTEEVIWFKYFV